MCFNSSTGLRSFQLDEQWFNLHKDLLRDALDITPANDNNPFVAPPSSDTVIDYVNTLGYPNMLRNVSAMSVNALYQPWRVVLSMINMCLTGKTAGYDRPRHPTFLTDRKNLATDARSKKKTAHLLIPNVRFTKLIIHHLRTKHNIHPRTGSPLHHSHNESILNTLRFVVKDDEERGKAVKEGATESSEATKVTKPKAAKATKPAGDKAPKPTATQPPIPKPKPTQSSKVVSEKKCKLVKETPDEPSPAKRTKGGLVTKKCKPKSPLKLVDEPSNEGVPVKEPAYNEEDANLERALELSLMEQGAQTQGPTRPVVIREPKSGRIQPFPKVQGKGKEKVIEEQAAHDLLTLQTLTKKSLASKINVGSQDEGQAGPNPGEQDEGQARPNPGTLNEGQARSNPGDTAGSQPPPSHVVHDGPNLEHMDLETTDASTQHKAEQMDEGFTITAYLNVQENLKLPTKDQVILKEPASSTGTLPSLQNLDKDLSFTDQFFVEKPHE
ncbi:retrovirus-related pol polyprotein from transposon TNT 1-94 [Tanacetum coccineum]